VHGSVSVDGQCCGRRGERETVTSHYKLRPSLTLQPIIGFFHLEAVTAAIVTDAGTAYPAGSVPATSWTPYPGSPLASPHHGAFQTGQTTENSQCPFSNNYSIMLFFTALFVTVFNGHLWTNFSFCVCECF